MNSVMSFLKNMFGGGNMNSPDATPSTFGMPQNAGSSAPSFSAPPLKVGDITFSPAPKIPSAASPAPVVNAPAPVGNPKAPASGGGAAPSSAPGSSPASSPAASSPTSSSSPATPPGYIPWDVTKYGAPTGLTQTKTPQGGTAWQDAQGNMYVQDAGGFKLVTSLPGQNGTTTQFYNPKGAVSAADAAAQAEGAGQGTSGISSSTTVNPVGPGSVPVGPATAPVVTPPTSLPSFSAGGVPTTFDIGSLVSGLTSVESGLSDGSMDAPTAAEMVSKLQAGIQAEITAATANPSTPAGTTFNVSPSAVSNGDPTIESAIAGDPAGFNALNEQFGVPQLQSQYVNALTSVNSITNAVNKLTNEINSNPEIPQWLAARQVGYLADKANELTTPLSGQASTIKAQLDYATANMKLYYQQQNTQARLAISSKNQMLSQFKTALTNGGIDATDPASISSWSGITGFPEPEVYAMATNANLTKALTISGKQATQAANQMMLAAANDPQYVQGMASALSSGSLTIQDLPYATGRGTIGSALTSKIMMAAQGMANAEGNPNGINFSQMQAQYAYAASPSVKTQVAAIQTTKNMSDTLLSLSNDAIRSNYPTMNAAIEATGIQFGGTTYNNWQQFMTAYQDSLSGALGYGSASDMTREMGAEWANPNQSPAQFLSAFNEVVQPALQAKEDAFASQMGPYASSAGIGSNASGGSTSDPAGLGL